MTVHLPVLRSSAEKLRGRRKRAVRASTILTKRLPKFVLDHGRAEADATLAELGPIERPRTREDCVDGPRPCPFVSCKHHLYLDVSKRTGSIKLNFPDVDEEHLEQLPASCVLDVVDERGAVTLERTGDLMNMTRERIRQVENAATKKLGEAPGNLADYRHHASAQTGPLVMPNGGSGDGQDDAQEHRQHPPGHVWELELLDDAPATNTAQDRTWRAYVGGRT